MSHDESDESWELTERLVIGFGSYWFRTPQSELCDDEKTIQDGQHYLLIYFGRMIYESSVAESSIHRDKADEAGKIMHVASASRP